MTRKNRRKNRVEKCMHCKTEIRVRSKDEMPQCEWLEKLDFSKPYKNCECGRCVVGWI